MGGRPELWGRASTLNTGLPGRLRRPSVARTAWSFGGLLEGPDHAARASSGLILSRNRRISALIPGEPGMDLVRSGTQSRVVVPAQSHARHPDVARFFSGTWSASIRFFRLRPSGPSGRSSVPVTQRRTIGAVARGLIASAPCAPRPTLAWVRSEPSSLRDDGLTRSPAGRGLRGLGLRRWHAGGLPRSWVN